MIATAKRRKRLHIYFGHYSGANGITVEGTAEDLLATGILHPDDELPKKPRGCIVQPGWYERQGGAKIAMLANGMLRVNGRPLDAARNDIGFGAFLVRALYPVPGGFE